MIINNYLNKMEDDNINSDFIMIPMKIIDTILFVSKHINDNNKKYNKKKYNIILHALQKSQL
jgi:hypothetical protein